jgi:hypothetical protein
LSWNFACFWTGSPIASGRRPLTSLSRTTTLNCLMLRNSHPRRSRSFISNSSIGIRAQKCRFYRNGLESEAWHENELRLFVWVLVTYSNVERRPICEFVTNAINQTTENWLYLSHIFHGKNPLLCEFQYMNIRRTQAKTEAWSQEEDNLVLKIIG